MSVYISEAYRKAVRERAKGLCEYCLFHEEHAYFTYEVDHFSLQEDQIKPASPIGEVTVKLLLFNHPDRVLERQLLIKAGRYPHAVASSMMNGD